MLKPLTSKSQQQELFCQKYWRAIKKQAIQNNHTNETLSLFDYYSFNHILLGINPLEENSKNLLGKLDLSFKLFTPCKKKHTVWRGVTDPTFYEEKAVYDYFNKCKKVKPGETLRFKEFSYVTPDSDYAKSHISPLAKDFVNILFQIEIPKGTAYLNNGFKNVLQRNSKFLCTETQRVNDGEKTYQLIKLKLLPRDIQQDRKSPIKKIVKLLTLMFQNISSIFR